METNGPIRVARASERLKNFARQQPMVFYNKPFNERQEFQRLQHLDPQEKALANLELGLLGDGPLVDETVRAFLRGLELPTTIVLHFHGHGEPLATAVVQLTHIYWTARPELYPRLDFEHPPTMEKILGGPMWGDFVTAVAEVPGEEIGFCNEDSDGAEFIRICSRWMQRNNER